MTILTDITLQQSASAQEKSAHAAPARSHLGACGVAWTSIGMFFALMIAGGVNVWLAVSGAIPLWVGTIISIVVLYYLEHINHEAVHANISGADTNWRWLNELIGHVGNFWMFLPLPAFRAVHFSHHRSTNHPTLDCDMWFAQKTRLGVLARCSTLLLGYEITLQRLAKLGLVEKRTMAIIYGTRLLWVAMIGVAIYFGYGVEVFMLWVLPALLAMPVLAFLFAFVVHHPHTGKERYQASNVLISDNKIFHNIMTAVFLFQNYHLVHHLHPRLPFYKYGQAFREIREQLESKNASITKI